MAQEAAGDGALPKAGEFDITPTLSSLLARTERRKCWSLTRTLRVRTEILREQRGNAGGTGGAELGVANANSTLS